MTCSSWTQLNIETITVTPQLSDKPVIQMVFLFLGHQMVMSNKLDFFVSTQMFVPLLYCLYFT